MADTTPTYGFPFLELGDPPDLAAGTEDLATAVEAKFVSVDAKIALLNAKPIMVSAACTTDVNLTTTEVDVTGASVTFSTTKTNARYLVTASFYVSAVTGGTAVATGKLNVDGANQSANANFTGTDTLARANVSQSWVGTLAAIGSHTLKLRAVASAGTGSFRVNTGGTAFTVVVFES